MTDEDNRRRIKPNLLDEIEEHEGDTFTESLLNWHRKQDTMSEIVEKTEQAFQDAVEGNVHESEEELRERIDELRNQRQDTLSKSDVREAVEEALPSGMYQ